MFKDVDPQINEIFGWISFQYHRKPSGVLSDLGGVFDPKKIRNRDRMT